VHPFRFFLRKEWETAIFPRLGPPQQNGGPQATVVRIGRGAYRASTAQSRHPHRGTRSQESEATLHRPR
jgi:hypothetical protein